MDKFVGKRLDGRYEIQEIIGVGGMAVVYKARDNVEDRIVAIKILKEEFVSNEEFIRRFKNESKAIAVLSHPNIVKVYDVSFGDLIQYIVMEYIDGITLKEYIERQGSLRWKDAVYFAIQILKGLQHAHDKGIVHRDVKPQNIMVLQDGTIKVTDFGIARFARSEQRTITDKAIGSVHYISPEQARGEKTDEKADIYSVGVMLYEMITGKLPFQADSAVSVAIMQLQRDPQLPMEINPSIPLGLQQITMHAMQKNIERRYQSAAEMLCDLEQFKKDPTATFEYTYFVDNSPTRFINNEDAEVAAAVADGVASKDSDRTKSNKNSTIPILAGIAAALVIVLVVLGIFALKLINKKTGDEIDCPQLIGKTEEEVKKLDEENDTFFVEKYEYDYNSDYDSGVVFKQKPDNNKIKSGSGITVYVSMGTSTVEVPDVYGKKESYATSTLKSKGFTYVISEMADDDVEEGFVIKTEPKRTTVVSKGTEITVYVSTGKSKKMVPVPDVIGLKQAAAKSEIEDAGLVPTFETRPLTTKDSEYMAKGYVIEQNPAPTSSATVAEGTGVTVYVSDGTVTLDVNVSLSDKITEYDSVTLSLWVDNKNKAESDTSLSTKDLSRYTFKNFSAQDKTVYATLKIGAKDGNQTVYVDYADIKIDAMTGKVEIIKRLYSEEKKKEPW